MGMIDADNKKIIDAILKIAKAMKALIVDGGSASGVMKEIGEAVRRDGDHVATLGIFPWEAVAGRKELELDDGKVYIGFDGEDGDREELRKIKAELDRNHRYFALITNPSPRFKDSPWASEIEARYYIEHYLTDRTDESALLGKVLRTKVMDEHKPRPHVLIVVNGGLGTVDTAHMFLTGKFNTDFEPSDSSKDSEFVKLVPMVVIHGSGRAADLIVHVLEANDTIHDTLMSEEKFKLLLGRYRLKSEEAASVPEVARKLGEIWKRKKSVFIHKVDNKSKHTLAFDMMKAICEGTMFKDGTPAYESSFQLKLLMDWNDREGLDIMREILIRNLKKTGENSDDNVALIESMRHALKYNLVDSVSLLHDFRVEISQATLISLYEDGADTFKTRINSSSGCCIGTAKRMLRDLVYLKDCTIRPEGSDPSAESVAYQCSYCRSAKVSPHSSLTVNGREMATRDDMLLWSIFSGRFELAWYFWLSGGRNRTVHCMSRALMACAILRAAREASGSFFMYGFRSGLSQLGLKQLNADLSSAWASKFELAARDILDLCYQKNPEMAVSLLTLPWVHPKDWFPVLSCLGSRLANPLTIALSARARSFVSHQACQDAINRLWYGRVIFNDVTVGIGGLAEVWHDRQTRIPLRPTGWRIEHFGLLGCLGRMGRQGPVLALNMLLSTVLFLPVLLSTVKQPLAHDSSRGQMEGTDREDSSGGPESTKTGLKGLLWGLKRATKQKALGFYNAPCVKFHIDFASYLTFLILYTALGFQFSYEYSVLEGLVHLWIVALAMRQWYSFWHDGNRLIFGSNYFEVGMLLCYLPAAGLRIYERSQYDKAQFMALGDTSNHSLDDGVVAKYSSGAGDWARARSWHGIAGVLFWVRIVDYFRASRTLGPLVPVLISVSWQAVQFFILLLVAIVAFGSAIICAGRPRYDPAEGLPAHFAQAVFFPYFEIFGEHFLDGYNISIRDYPGCHHQDPGCSPQQSLGIILLCIYLFISAIVLMNLLIASTLSPPRHHAASYPS
jgi:hypothetical protein